jgi:hypothetical protein
MVSHHVTWGEQPLEGIKIAPNANLAIANLCRLCSHNVILMVLTLEPSERTSLDLDNPVTLCHTLVTQGMQSGVNSGFNRRVCSISMSTAQLLCLPTTEYCENGEYSVL